MGTVASWSTPHWNGRPAARQSAAPARGDRNAAPRDGYRSRPTAFGGGSCCSRRCPAVSGRAYSDRRVARSLLPGKRIEQQKMPPSTRPVRTSSIVAVGTSRCRHGTICRARDRRCEAFDRPRRCRRHAPIRRSRTAAASRAPARQRLAGLVGHPSGDHRRKSSIFTSGMTRLHREHQRQATARWPTHRR
jgi:hypothetical protein